MLQGGDAFGADPFAPQPATTYNSVDVDDDDDPFSPKAKPAAKSAPLANIEGKRFLPMGAIIADDGELKWI